MNESRERAPLSQRMKTVYLMCGAVGGVMGVVLITVIRRRFLRWL